MVCLNKSDDLQKFRRTDRTRTLAISGMVLPAVSRLFLLDCIRMNNGLLGMADKLVVWYMMSDGMTALCMASDLMVAL